MADYGCWPLWESGADVYNVDPESLPISTGLKRALANWATEYDRTLDRADPPRSGFPSVAAAECWLAIGDALAVCLRDELDAVGWEVGYIHASETPATLVAKSL
jgi:hypothetical protein